MKKITIFMCVILMALALNAQEKKMFIHQKGGGVAEYTVANVDSITFGVSDTEQGVWINGLYWAKCNVNTPGTFAPTPYHKGMFYKWNNKVGWTCTDPLKNSDYGEVWDATYYYADKWEEENDPCPLGWRVPTKAEFESLVTAANKFYEEENVISGWFFGSTKQLFLPVAGHREVGGILAQTNTSNGRGHYWSSTFRGVPPADYEAYQLYFYFNGVWADNEFYNISGAKNVRCVKK